MIDWVIINVIYFLLFTPYLSVLHLIADHIAALFLLGFDKVHVECSLGQVQSSHNIIGGSLVLDLEEVRIHELAAEIGSTFSLTHSLIV